MSAIRNAWCKEGCKVPNCKNNRANRKDLSFFRFPKDRERCLYWINNSSLTELLQIESGILYKKYRICGDHFEDYCFMNINTRNKLVPNAIPTIFSLENQGLTSNYNKEQIDDAGLGSSFIKNDTKVTEIKTEPTDDSQVQIKTEPLQDTPVVDTATEIFKLKRLIEINHFKHEERLKKIRLKLKLQRRLTETANRKVKRLTSKLNQDIIEKNFNKLPETGKMFLKMQLRLNKQKSTREGCYTEAERQTCIKLYCKGPKVYQGLREMFFMPAPKTLNQGLENIPIIDQKFQIEDGSINTSEDEKSNLSFKEMSREGVFDDLSEEEEVLGVTSEEEVNDEISFF